MYHVSRDNLTLDANGQVVSEMRYYPFGETRWVSGTMPTNRTFTGQLAEPNGLGSLMNYNAREFSPILGRFLSADTIVPNPGNPNSFNRYSYVENAPLSRIDPSGHGDCNVHEQAGCFYTNDVIKNSFDSNGYGLTFTGLWDKWHVESIIKAAAMINSSLISIDWQTAMAKAHGIWESAEGICTLCALNGKGEVFRAIIGNWAIKRVDENPPWGADTDGGTKTIQYYNVMFDTNALDDYQNPAHEFGHAFDVAASYRPRHDLINTQVIAGGERIAGGTEDFRTNYGYQFDGKHYFPWQQHGLNFPPPPVGLPLGGGEDFADMFMNWLGSTFTRDTYGTARFNWINTNMPDWIALAVKH